MAAVVVITMPNGLCAYPTNQSTNQPTNLMIMGIWLHLQLTESELAFCGLDGGRNTRCVLTVDFGHWQGQAGQSSPQLS